jgi:hypothetical protein
MLYCVASIPHSGSTWLYQVTTSLLQLSGPLLTGGFAVESQHLQWGRRSVYKFHGPHHVAGHAVRSGAGRLLYSYRDMRDIAYAWMHKAQKPFSVFIQYELPRHLSWDKFWTALPITYCMRYEDFWGNSLACVRAIAEALRVQASDDQLIEIDQLYSFEQNVQRAEAAKQRLTAAGIPLTGELSACPWRHQDLLHWNHLRTGQVGVWREAASEEELQQLALALTPWLIAHKYESDENWVSRVLDARATAN